jgi:hypothetical protein
MHHRGVHVSRRLLGVRSVAAQRMQQVPPVAVPGVRRRVRCGRDGLPLLVRRPQLHGLLVRRGPLGVRLLLNLPVRNSL